jgi:chemotaxis protein methyltransferase CheR
MSGLDIANSATNDITNLVRTYAGLVFPPNRWPEVERVIRKTMANVGVAEPQDFVRLLQANRQVLEGLIGSLTVGETYFFREPAQFEMLRHEILPALRDQHQPGSRLRLWSAGCASGEEAYSLAIALEQEGFIDNAVIIGTDISRAALAQAAKAVYGPWSLRGGLADVIGQYFHRQDSRRRGERFVLLDRIRRRVAFNYLNLAADEYPSPANGTAGSHVILCRNVLIYFEPEAAARVARRLFDSLAEGGWLITGPSDPPLWDLAPFETVVTEGGVFYRRGTQTGIRRRQTVNPVPRPQPPAVGLPKTEQPPAPEIATKIAAEIPPAIDSLAEARLAFSKGDFEHVLRRTRDMADDAEACVLRIRAAGNLGDRHHAEAAASAAVQKHPLCTEIQYLRAIVLMDLGRHEEAAVSLRRVIYLDRSLAAAHFTLGSALLRYGAVTEARRAYQNAFALCASRPEDEVVPLSEGERAGRLAGAAKAQLASIDENSKGLPCDRHAS